MLANLLIGLREGLEAALVVGILLAYLVRTGRRELIAHVWLGVAGAVLLSVGVLLALNATAHDLTERGQEIFAGVLSIGAVGLVTWMILWMRSAARSLRSRLDGALENALVGGRLAVVATAFVAVAREGIETALFLWTSLRAAGQGGGPAAGALIGLGLAVALGVAIYRGALRVNLGTFFTWTGVALIAVAGWVLAYGIEELAEAGALTALAVTGEVGEVLAPALAAAYVAVMLVLFFRTPPGPRVPGPRTPTPQDASVPVVKAS